MKLMRKLGCSVNKSKVLLKRKLLSSSSSSSSSVSSFSKSPSTTETELETTLDDEIPNVSLFEKTPSPPKLQKMPKIKNKSKSKNFDSGSMMRSVSDRKIGDLNSLIEINGSDMNRRRRSGVDGKIGRACSK